MSSEAFFIEMCEANTAWAPNTMHAKGSLVNCWIVENTKRVSDYCKDQLLVCKYCNYVSNWRLIGTEVQTPSYSNEPL